MGSFNGPLVSVLMTAFNRDKYIAEAIESVLKSSYRHFELIIVDDCSTDNSLVIARRYELLDNRVKVIANEKNVGQFANRNKAASYANGVYLKYLDSDDLIYKYALESMVDSMESFPEAGIGFCDSRGQSETPFPFLIQSKRAYEIHYFKGGLLFSGPSGTIIRRKYFKGVKGFQEFGMPSDIHLNLKLASVAPVVALQRDLFYWRIHEHQVFVKNKNNYDNVLNNYLFNSDILKNYSPLSKEINSQVIRNMNKIFYKNVIHLALMKGQIAKAFSLLRKRPYLHD